jgi:uncharacterized alkaline shock family protein YloU
MSDELLLHEQSGTISVPAATLDRIVVQAAERVDGVRVRRPRRGVDVALDGGARVTVQVAVRYGTVLPELAETVQREVHAALSSMCGVDVRAVDVGIEELVEP